MTQEHQDDRKVGIYFSNFERDIYEDILHIYDSVAFSQGSLPFQERYIVLWRRILEDLSLRGASEWRYGSSFGDSKILIRLGANSVVSFELNPNIRRQDPNFDVGNEKAREFQRKVRMYLEEKGIAEEA